MKEQIEELRKVGETVKNSYEGCAWTRVIQ